MQVLLQVGRQVTRVVSRGLPLRAAAAACCICLAGRAGRGAGGHLGPVLRQVRQGGLLHAVVGLHRLVRQVALGGAGGGGRGGR